MKMIQSLIIITEEFELNLNRRLKIFQMQEIFYV